jgi:hypothetical protein
MKPEEFTRLMRLAHGMGYYGAGYERGLRRFFQADKDDPERHRALMALAHSANPSCAATGRGYRDGFAGRLPTPEAEY